MPKPTTIEKKIIHIFQLLGKLAMGTELYPQDTVLQEELGVHERTVDRCLKDIYNLYGHIVLTERKKVERNGRKVTVYKAAATQNDKIEILRFFLNNSNDLGWLLQSVHENDPTILDDLDDRETIEKHIKKDEDIFLFKSNPFENFESEQAKKLFETLKNGVKKRAVLNIDYRYPPKEEMLNECYALKLIYMNNNWYLAVEHEEKVRFLRITFIKSTTAGWKSKYTKSLLKKYELFFKTLQNPFTLNQPSQKVHLKAVPSIAFYYKEGMKPFFPSQEFVREYEDGSVEFTVSYTQPMEVLPFIKQWQPSMTIVAPDSLREQLLRELQASIANHTL